MSQAQSITTLEQLRLVLSADHWKAIERELLPRFPDPKDLIRDLVKRNWLTTFQANQLARGKGIELVMGPYVLLDQLGEGGMGSVYRARHTKFNNLVAIKALHQHRLQNPQAVKRFLREIAVIMQLSHPHIVKALDAGTAGQTHYLAMELVSGIDLSKFVKQKGPLPVPESCDFIRQAALGLQHAHERGMVHRDIKPSNLFLTTYQHEGRKHAVIKLLDMGLTLVEDSQGDNLTHLTRDDVVVGTPDYISPEQAVAAHKVDSRADLYSLGCTLYFLLTGRPPFHAGKTTIEKLLRHQTEKPDPLSSLRRDIPPALDALVLKLLQKRPADRVQSAAELAAALEPFCRADAVAAPAPIHAPVAKLAQTIASSQDTKSDLPVHASVKASNAKFAQDGLQRFKRLPSQVKVGLGCLAGFLVLILVVWIAFLGAKPTETQTTKHPDNAPADPGSKPIVIDESPVVQVHAQLGWQDSHIDVEMPAGVSEVKITLLLSGTWIGEAGGMSHTPVGDPNSSSTHRLAPHAPFMGLLLRVGDDDTPLAVTRHTERLHLKKSGRLFFRCNDTALEDNQGAIQIDVQGGKWVAEPAEIPPPTRAERAHIAWKKLVPQTQVAAANPEWVIRDVQDFLRQHAGTPAAAEASIALAHLLPMNPSLLDALDHRQIPELEQFDWQPKQNLVGVLGKHFGMIWGSANALALTADGRRVAIGTYHGAVHVWDSETLRQIAYFRPSSRAVNSLSFAPNGNQLLVVGPTKQDLLLYDVEKSTVLQRIDGTTGLISPEGRYLVYASENQVILKPMEGEEKARVLSGHQGPVRALAMARGVPRLISASFGFGMAGERTLRMWDLDTGNTLWSFPLPQMVGQLYGVGMSEDGEHVYVHGSTSLFLVDGKTGANRQRLQRTSPNAVRLLPQGQWFYTAGPDHLLYKWETKSQAQLQEFSAFPSRLQAMDVSANERLLVAGASDGRVYFWDATTAGRRHTEERGSRTFSLAFSPDGKQMVSGHEDRTIRNWILPSTSRPSDLLRGHTGPITGLAFHPDNKRILSAGDRSIRMWEAGKPDAIEIVRTDADCAGLALSPDGRLVAFRFGKSAQVWDLDKQRLAHTFDHEGPVTSLGFSPLGLLVTASVQLGYQEKSVSIRLWDPEHGTELASFRPPGSALDIAFSLDGRTMLAVGEDGVRHWDFKTGFQDEPTLLRTSTPANSISMSPDGSRFATCNHQGHVTIWSLKGKKLHDWHLPGPVYQVRFAPDGRHLATANSNGTVYFLRVPQTPSS